MLNIYDISVSLIYSVQILLLELYIVYIYMPIDCANIIKKITRIMYVDMEVFDKTKESSPTCHHVVVTVKCHGSLAPCGHGSLVPCGCNHHYSCDFHL